MQTIKRFNESNGPAYGKEETTKKGLKFMPLTTDNPVITDPLPSEDDEDINDGDDGDTSFSDKYSEFEIKIPKRIIDKNIKKRKIMKRTKRFEDLYEKIGPASDSEFADNLKKQGEMMPDILSKEDEEIKNNGDIINGSVGDVVIVHNDDLQRMVIGLGHGGEHEITKITTDRDKKGNAHNIYWIGNYGFHQAGHQITSPWSYHITKK